MGLTTESIRFLAESWPRKQPPRRILTLGRQDLWAAPERLEALLREHRLWPEGRTSEAFRQSVQQADWRLAEFLRQMGVEEVHACDASDYEGADRLHDLNQPFPPDWDETYDWVIDGGTLEHVFHFSTALANAMRAVRTGGRLILFTTANNYCGHGFYQFSPELFWRVFSPANGYRVARLQAMVDTEGFSSLLGVKYAFPIRGPRYDVVDPAQVKERVLLVNDLPTLLFVEAVKERHVVPFQKAPQQSDYSAHWAARQSPAPLQQTGTGGRLARWLQRLFSERVCRELLPALAGWVDWRRRRRFLKTMSFRNRRHYRPVPRQSSSKP